MPYRWERELWDAARQAQRLRLSVCFPKHPPCSTPHCPRPNPTSHTFPPLTSGLLRHAHGYRADGAASTPPFPRCATAGFVFCVVVYHLSYHFRFSVGHRGSGRSPVGGMLPHAMLCKNVCAPTNETRSATVIYMLARGQEGPSSCLVVFIYPRTLATALFFAPRLRCQTT